MGSPDYTRRLCRKQPRRDDIWHLDEVVIRIAGKKHWLWRAVDQDGYVLDEIVQNHRNAKPSDLLMRLLKKQGVAPKRMITDKLRSYGAARRQMMPEVEHRSHKRLNNRAGNSHLPLRKRERTMQGFRSPGSLHASSRFSRLFAICSSRPTQNALLSTSTFTACKRWRNGTPLLGNSRELCITGSAQSFSDNVTTPL